MTLIGKDCQNRRNRRNRKTRISPRRHGDTEKTKSLPRRHGDTEKTKSLPRRHGDTEKTKSLPRIGADQEGLGYEKSGHRAASHPRKPKAGFPGRSEERRVGKECRSRWSP